MPIIEDGGTDSLTHITSNDVVTPIIKIAANTFFIVALLSTCILGIYAIA